MTGCAPRSIASQPETWPCAVGFNRLLVHLIETGVIRNQVIISASPISVGLEGAVCVPSAWRRKWKTTSRRTIGVMAIRIAGSRVISVRTKRIVQGVESEGCSRA